MSDITVALCPCLLQWPFVLVIASVSRRLMCTLATSAVQDVCIQSRFRTSISLGTSTRPGTEPSLLVLTSGTNFWD